MDIHEQANALLFDLGNSWGITLALDAEGACGLRIDDSLELTLRLEPGQQALLAYAQVHPVPDTDADGVAGAVLRRLLAANHVWEESQGATWSLRDGQVTLARLLPLHDLDAQQLAHALARFVDVARTEQQRLQGLAARAPQDQGQHPPGMLAV